MWPLIDCSRNIVQIASMVKSLAKAAICTYVCMYVAHVNTCMCACHGDDDDLMHVFFWWVFSLLLWSTSFHFREYTFKLSLISSHLDLYLFVTTLTLVGWGTVISVSFTFFLCILWRAVMILEIGRGTGRWVQCVRFGRLRTLQLLRHMRANGLRFCHGY